MVQDFAHSPKDNARIDTAAPCSTTAAAEHAHEKHDQDDPENHRTGTSGFANAALGFGSCCGFGDSFCLCRGAIELGYQRIHPCADPAGHVALLETRGNFIANNPARQRVGDILVKAIANLDPHLALCWRDQQQQPLIALLAADAPLFKQSDGIHLDGFAIER